jgi:hypothetical protein
MSSLRPAVLVISDTASQDPHTDKAGPALTETFSQRSSTWAAPIIRIVPDDPEQIQSAIKEWADNESDIYNLIVTSGGTGIAVRDVTPEVRGLESMHLPFIFSTANYSFILTLYFCLIDSLAIDTSPCAWSCVSIVSTSGADHI